MGRTWLAGAEGTIKKTYRTRRPRPVAPKMANAVGIYDFEFHACAKRQQLKCLTVVDEFRCEFLAIDVAGSVRSARVIEILSKLISVRGAPRYLRSDNGPDFVSVALLKWVSDQSIDLLLIDPGKPWQIRKENPL